MNLQLIFFCEEEREEEEENHDDDDDNNDEDDDEDHGDDNDDDAIAIFSPFSKDTLGGMVSSVLCWVPILVLVLCSFSQFFFQIFSQF